jgi:hypothetical protein
LEEIIGEPASPAGDVLVPYVEQCDANSSSQRWVYDRKSGTVRNTGDNAAWPGSGQCLAAFPRLESVPPLWNYKVFAVILVNCPDKDDPTPVDSHLLWTYDPQSQVLLNAWGTALSLQLPTLIGDVRGLPLGAATEPERVYAESYLKLGDIDGDGPLPAEYRDPSAVQWQTDKPISSGALPFSDMIGPGEKMRKGESRVSPDNQYELVLRTDGNLVLYKKQWDESPEYALPLWMSGTAGQKVDRLVMETNGNLVLYAAPGTPDNSFSCLPRQSCNALTSPTSRTGKIWETRTHRPLSYLQVQDDGLVIREPQHGDPVWHADTRWVVPPPSSRP